MNWPLSLTIAVTLSYLLGSVPFALLLGKVKGIDIRQAGSRNIGATNLTRLAGRTWGVAAFLLDFLKGLVAVLVTRWLWPWEDNGSVPMSPVHAQILAGLASILGHVFPLYLRFRGGKGVATTFGVMTGLLWLSAVFAGLSWGVAYLIGRTVSIASLVAALTFPVAVFVLKYDDPTLPAVLTLAVMISLLILIRHRTNISRLLSGKEHRF